MAIDISAVVIGPQLGEGGFGAVHEVVVVGTPIADDARAADGVEDAETGTRPGARYRSA